jgi:mitogen-activated protein kinase kinase
MSQKQMKNILMELEVLNNNKSPYIIDFFGAFYTRSSVYFCMEVMDLGSLGDMIKMLRGKSDQYPTIPDSFLGAIMYCVASGLHFLSKKLSIIHRDVKPTNLLMNKHGDIKLCDFGVSGYLVRSAAKTYVGSMTYMAPERVRSNQSGDYTIQADVWSLGATLYELVLGAPLYAVSGYDSAFAHLMAISVEPCPEIPDDSCSPEMNELIRSFLAKKPHERPTFEALLEHPLVAPYADHAKLQGAVIDFVQIFLPELMTRHIQEWQVEY